MPRSFAVLVHLLLAAGLVTSHAAEPAAPEKDAETWWSLKPIVKPIPPVVASPSYADWLHAPERPSNYDCVLGKSERSILGENRQAARI